MRVQNKILRTPVDFTKYVNVADDEDLPLPGESIPDFQRRYIQNHTVCGSDIDTLEAEPVQWMIWGNDTIRGVMNASGCTIMAADSTAGKTWKCIDLMLSRKASRKWLGHFNVRPGNTLYLAYEESVQDAKRRVSKIIAGRPELSAKVGNEYFWSEIPRGEFYGKFSADFTEMLVIMCKQYQIDLVVIDTLRQASGEANENDNAEMGMVVKNIRQLAERISGCALVTHHTPKGAGKDFGLSARGASAIRSNTQGLILLDTQQDNEVIMYVDKVKQGMEHPPMTITRVYSEDDSEVFFEVSEPEDRGFYISDEDRKDLGEEFSKSKFLDIVGKSGEAKKCFTNGTLEKVIKTSARGKEKILWKIKDD